MSKPGHYWCDHCDNNAYGSRCLTCHRPGRWVEAAVPKLKRVKPVPADLPAPTLAQARHVADAAQAELNPEHGQRRPAVNGAEWFRQMRELVAKSPNTL